MKKLWKQFKTWLQSDRVLFVISILLVLLNCADAGLSWLLIIHLNLAVEANPLMSFLMNQNILWFFLYKFITIPILTYFLYQVRRYSLAKFAIIFGFLVFLAVVLYTIVGFIYFLSVGII